MAGAAKRPVAPVTGADRGIGATVALALATDNFDVSVTDISEDDDDAHATLAGLHAGDAKAVFIRSDLADVPLMGVTAETVSQCGPITCFVGNAGVRSPSRGSLLDVKPEAFDQLQDMNLPGTFFLTQAVAVHMTASASPRLRSIVTVK